MQIKSNLIFLILFPLIIAVYSVQAQPHYGKIGTGVSMSQWTKTFVDVMKLSRPFQNIDGTATAEMDTLGFPVEDFSFHTDHAKIGAAYINHWWPVDDEVIFCARDHHLGLGNKSLSQTTRIVILANMFCNSIGLHNGVNIQVSPEKVEFTHFEALGLSLKNYKEYIELAKLDIETAKSILSR